MVVRTINGLGWTYSSHSLVAPAFRPVYRTLHRLAARFTAATIFQNRDDQAFFERNRMVGRGGSRLILGSGVDIEGFEQALAKGPSPAQLRQELGLGTSEVVVTVTRMTRQKGIPALLEAAALVHEARPSVRFLLVGPRQSEGPLAVTQAEIDRHAPYVTAIGRRSDIPSLLGLADVFAFPTEYREGVPRGLLEAALAGLPIVTTRMPGCVDVVRDGWNGYLVPPRSPRILAARILDLLRDREIARIMGARAAALVRRELSLGLTVARYAALYGELTGRSDRRRFRSTKDTQEREPYTSGGVLMLELCGLVIFSIFHLIVRYPIFWFAVAFRLVAGAGASRPRQCGAGADAMCGIVGILLAPHAADPRRLAAVEAMAATLHHRGPDSGGAWVDRDAGIALGHRRLAIVDLSEAGRQPMLSHSARLVMTFNGEVYNFAELRPELEALGHRFRGQSDSEVMLSAFESFGIEEALKRFAGMFAIGLWDRKGRILHLIRDRLGKKPLYIALLPGALLFASELKAIRAYPGFRPRVDPKALAMALRHGWVPDQCCIWEGVFKLPPGTMLSVRGDDLAAGGMLRQRARAWWSLAKIAQRQVSKLRLI